MQQTVVYPLATFTGDISIESDLFHSEAGSLTDICVESDPDMSHASLVNQPRS